MIEIMPLDLAKMMPVASKVAGQYLDGIGKSDCRTMTVQEWNGFLNVILTATWGTQMSEQINMSVKKSKKSASFITSDEVPF